MGFVYFIHNKDEISPIKIGKTSNHPSKRRSALQCGSSKDLIVHNFIECYDYTKLETILHRAFRHKKSKQGGSEWFDVDIKTIDLIYSAWHKSKLLLDEPFSNLDVDTRERLAFEVRDILKKTGHTAILVTHNQAEAFAIADRIGVMKNGVIAQWDTPYGIHHTPVNAFVADFVKREALMAQRAQAYLRGEAS